MEIEIYTAKNINFPDYVECLKVKYLNPGNIQYPQCRFLRVENGTESTYPQVEELSLVKSSVPDFANLQAFYGNDICRIPSGDIEQITLTNCNIDNIILSSATRRLTLINVSIAHPVDIRYIHELRCKKSNIVFENSPKNLRLKCDIKTLEQFDIPATPFLPV